MNLRWRTWRCTGALAQRAKKALIAIYGLNLGTNLEVGHDATFRWPEPVDGTGLD